MKCNGCQTGIPPTFTKALKENACPACGNSIMNKNIFSEFNGIMDKLKDADVDDPTLVRVAAIIAGKYDLVPRGVAGSHRPVQKTRPEIFQKASKAATSADDDEQEILNDYPHLRELPADERSLEIMAIRAEAEREWGLSKGDMMAAKMVKESGGSSEFDFSALSEDLITPPLDLPPQRNMSPETLHRLAKAEALRNDPSAKAFRRRDG